MNSKAGEACAAGVPGASQRAPAGASAGDSRLWPAPPPPKQAAVGARRRAAPRRGAARLVLRGEAALRGNVDDEQHLRAERRSAGSQWPLNPAEAQATRPCRLLLVLARCSPQGHCGSSKANPPAPFLLALPLNWPSFTSLPSMLCDGQRWVGEGRAGISRRSRPPCDSRGG